MKIDLVNKVVPNKLALGKTSMLLIILLFPISVFSQCGSDIFTQGIKTHGTPTICDILLLDNSHPLATQDCDRGGIDNLTECLSGANPEDPSDDVACVDLSSSSYVTGTVDVVSYYIVGCNMNEGANQCQFDPTQFHPADPNIGEILGATECFLLNDLDICNTTGISASGTPTCDPPLNPTPTTLIETLFPKTDLDGLPEVAFASDGYWVPTNAAATIMEGTCTNTAFGGGDVDDICYDDPGGQGAEWHSISGWVLAPCGKDLTFQFLPIGLQYSAAYISIDEKASFQFVGECAMGGTILSYTVPSYDCCGADYTKEKAYYFKLFVFDPSALGSLNLMWNHDPTNPAANLMRFVQQECISRLNPADPTERCQSEDTYYLGFDNHGLLSQQISGNPIDGTFPIGMVAFDDCMMPQPTAATITATGQPFCLGGIKDANFMTSSNWSIVDIGGCGFIGATQANADNPTLCEVVVNKGLSSEQVFAVSVPVVSPGGVLSGGAIKDALETAGVLPACMLATGGTVAGIATNEANCVDFLGANWRYNIDCECTLSNGSLPLSVTLKVCQDSGDYANYLLKIL